MKISGGERQRIGIVRALCLEPELIVCDEAVSALDVSIQAQVLKLLMQLKKEKNLTYLFITHDLSVTEYLCDRIAVMYLGRIVELCDSEDLYNNTLHPYSEALISAIPVADLTNKRKELFWKEMYQVQLIHLKAVLFILGVLKQLTFVKLRYQH